MKRTQGYAQTAKKRRQSQHQRLARIVSAGEQSQHQVYHTPQRQRHQTDAQYPVVVEHIANTQIVQIGGAGGPKVDQEVFIPLG
ncbi:MAG: hypothetical protein DBX99_02005 [Clostridiales bacterium]|nr:MAG: hypothetical protein DBX99_02005 [Clostridiales bacterium]HCG34424.1 hypothetical protein [Oscillospiraceae bacterium]